MIVDNSVVQKEYQKDAKLNQEDVKMLLDWADKQLHLPKITELQAILFLQTCSYSNEMAKIRMDNFFTVRTMTPELFSDRNPLSDSLKEAFNTVLMTVLPNQTPEGYVCGFAKVIDSNPAHFNATTLMKQCDMASSAYIYNQGTCNGYVIILDFEGVVLAHLFKLPPSLVRTYFAYVMEAMPVRLKQVHMVNLPPFIERIMSFLKPLMPKELVDMLNFHTKGVDSLFEAIPQKCVPNEIGGTCGTYKELHEVAGKLLLDNIDIFKWEESQLVIESKRADKQNNANKAFGMEGTFKKLEID